MRLPLSIRLKLTLVFVSFFVIFGAFTVFTVDRMTRLNDLSTEMEVNWLPSAIATATMNRLSSDYRIAEAMHVLSESEKEKRSLETVMDSLEQQVDDWRQQYEPLISSASEKDIYEEFITSYMAYLKASRRTIAFSESNLDGLATVQVADSGTVFDDFSARLQELVDLNQSGAIRASENANDVFANSREALIIGLVVILGLALMTAILLDATISRALGHITDSVYNLAQGDLNVTVPYIGRTDEMGILAQGLEIFKNTAVERERLLSAVEEARKTAEAAVKHLEITQKQLVEREKMASLGGLVAGVAHEINTPVGVSLTAATHLAAETKKVQSSFEAQTLNAEDLQHYIDTASECSALISSNANRASDLIRSFKQVAVDQTGDQQRRFNLRQYIDEVVLSLRPHYKKTKHKIVVDCPDDITLDTRPGPLAQIFTNLIVNSIIHGFENMDQGKITIKAARHGTDWVAFEYSDNGQGVTPEVREKIFDPFFTTKRSGGGSGLGMMIVYNAITRQLQGEVEISSRPKSGLTLIMRIPARLTQVNIDKDEAE